MTARLIVDSCVAIKWFVTEADTPLADATVRPGIRSCAPDFALVEIANALWKNERLGRIDQSAVSRAIARLPQIFDELLPSQDLIGEASTLARTIDHPIYDCIYVVAARRTSARLVTTDKKLLRKLAKTPDAALAVDLAKWTP